jgi:1,4-dihydroxy-2-naphthoate octaprenyltransferase
VFQTIQVVRDHDHDRASAVRTTAVHLGPRKTLWLTRALMVLSAAYAAAFLHPLAAALAATALALPASSRRAARYWTGVKVVYGLSWLTTCAVVFLRGETSGALWSIQTSAVLPFLHR